MVLCLTSSIIHESNVFFARNAQFLKMVKIPDVDVLGKLGVQNRDERGLIQVMPSKERYFGEELRKTAPKGVGAFLMSQSQQLSMEVSLGTSIFAQFAFVLRT